MSVKIGKNSRLRFADLATVDGVEFWDLPEYPAIESRNDDIQYQVSDGDRIDSLATKFYGDPTLWWVIAVANDLDLIPSNLVPAATITIPSPTWVSAQLFATAKAR
jgi:nucleoid-associated protein YgaU